MKLYHGTAAVHLPAIRARGLVPRGRANRRSNWDHSVRSRAGHVYLTTAYPLYFAICAGTDARVALLVEVDTGLLDRDLLRPDEDFLAQVQARQAAAAGALHRPVLSHLTQAVDLDANRGLWDKSVELLGTCSYRGTVPASAITRYATVDVALRKDLAVLGLDPSISLENYRFCGWKYRQLVAWIFGDVPDLPGPVPAEHMAQLADLPGLADQVDAVRRASRDRGGIDVVRVD